MSLGSVVRRLAKKTGPKLVTRRPALVYVDTSPRSVAGPADVLARVTLHMQRDQTQGTHLVRRATGDESTGEARVWVDDRSLGKAYLDGDVGKTPLGWTGLQIAPPEETDGPPGDMIAWKDRRWEVTEDMGWDESFGAGAKFRRYVAMDRGAA